MMGLRIAALRRSAGWSQAELAQRLKISPSAVGMYEQGRREPALEIVVALSKLFGVSIDYLVTGNTDARQDRQAFVGSVSGAVEAAQRQLCQRRQIPFSREEMTVLFAALLMEP